MAANHEAAKKRLHQQRSNGSAADPCMCFRMCTDADVLDFHARLPVVHSTQSPWHAYLSEVYGGVSDGGVSAVRHPINLSTFEAFYPTLPPAQTKPCAANHSDAPPRCALCAGRLKPTVKSPHSETGARLY